MTPVLVVAALAPGFWLWRRHHDPLGWYTRPLFMAPFCLSAYWRGWAGVMATLLAALTSMGWFPAPLRLGSPVTDK